MPHREFFHISATGDRFICFSNADGKRWIMPLKDMRTAMNLYQPSGIKGRLVKRFLPFVYNFPFLCKFINAEFINIDLTSGVSQKIAQTLGVKDFKFAIFEGTPSVHQKATIQIWDGGRILAYCKISNNDDVGRLFEQERVTLSGLHLAGVTQIPQSLFCGEAGKFHLFIQSTTKTNRSFTDNELSYRHLSFLSQLRTKTMVRTKYTNSDLYKYILFLEQNTHLFLPCDIDTVQHSIFAVSNYFGNDTYCFSGFHADFTSWNMFIENDRLFVFDLEYYQHIFPPYLDLFHFVIQTAINQRGFDSKKSYEYYCLRREYFNDIKDKNMMFVCYLLFILSFYFQRNNQCFNHTDRSYKCWVGLLRTLRAELNF